MGVVTAVIALAVAGALTWKRRLPKTVALLALVAGSALTTGFVGHILHKVAHWVAGLTASLTSAAFGVAVPSALVVVALIVFVHDVWPGNKAGRLTAGIGLMLPPLIAYVGGAAGSLAGSGIGALGGAVSSALRALFGGA